MNKKEDNTIALLTELANNVAPNNTLLEFKKTSSEENQVQHEHNMETWLWVYVIIGIFSLVYFFVG